MYLTRAILYYAVAVLWLLRTLRAWNIFDLALTVALLIAGTVYGIRYIKQKKSRGE